MKFERFKDIIIDKTSNYRKISRNDYLQEGKYIIIDQGKEFIGGYTNDIDIIVEHSSPIIIFGDHTKILKFIDFPIAIGADGVKVLYINENRAFAKYVYYYLKSLTLPDAGYSRHFKFLKEVEIPVPEKIEDQIGIALILSKVETLITERKNSIHLLDKYTASVFTEMFGDKSKIKISEYLLDNLKDGGNETFSNGPFGSDLLTTELTNSGVPVIYIRDIRNGFFEWKSDVYITKEKAKSLVNCRVVGGDILIAKVGAPPGITAVYPKDFPDAVVTQDVIRLRLSQNKVNPIYLQYLLNSDIGKHLIKKITTDGTRNRFSLGNFKKLRVDIHDINMQNKFATLVEKSDHLKRKYQESLQGFENLFNSLSQLGFKGELILSGIHSKSIHKEIKRIVGNKQKKPIEIKPKKKTEDGTSYNDHYNIDKLTAKRKGISFYDERFRIHSKMSLPDQKSIFLQSKRNGKNLIPLKFSEVEGNAVIEEIYTKKKGFSYTEFETFLKKEKITHTPTQVRDFLFNKLEQKELIQHFASKEWIESIRLSKSQSPGGSDFVEKGIIWFLASKSEKIK
jgi:type I restriction enzyme S subunit